MPEYRVVEGSPQEQFGTLRSKVQIFAGGYGNGKTAAACVQKALPVAKMYPGANILMARSTYPKLNDTLRAEFIKWIPPKWIKSFPLSKNSDNTCVLTNGTRINFRYIAQQGKGATMGEQTTSNLLSATYDLIIVDQLEDPEISHKDFMDLLGRLRGSTRYIGDDPTMPLDGPRWLIACVNPTRNWVFKELVKPLQIYQNHGLIDEGLLCTRYPRDHPLHGQPVVDDTGKPELLISLVEGSTYTNKHNLGEDFMQVLESAYKGQQKDRYLYGEWASYEGLVHSEFNEAVHCIPRKDMEEHFNNLLYAGIACKFIEGYDYGLAVPACYMLGFVDRYKNVFITDGWYEAEIQDLDDHALKIWEIRNKWSIYDNKVRADPSIFKRTQVGVKSRSKTIAELFKNVKNPVKMTMGDNNVESGITKINSYLAVKDFHRHPISGEMGAPHLYVASELEFLTSEFHGYMWQKNTMGMNIDKPIEINDHAMNTLKYMLSKEPSLATRPPKQQPKLYLNKWTESGNEGYQSSVAHRYG